MTATEAKLGRISDYSTYSTGNLPIHIAGDRRLRRIVVKNKLAQTVSCVSGRCGCSLLLVDAFHVLTALAGC